MARHNKNSVYYVLEDKKENIIRRYALKYAHITKEELNSGRISEDKVRIFNHAVKEYNKTPVNMIDV
jgi:replicative DNA helicase